MDPHHQCFSAWGVENHRAVAWRNQEAILRPELDVIGLDGGREPRSVAKHFDHCISSALDGRSVTRNEKKNAMRRRSERRRKNQLQLHGVREVGELLHHSARSENLGAFMLLFSIA